MRQLALALLALAAGSAAGAEMRPDEAGPLVPGQLLFKGADTALGTQAAAAWSLGDKRWGHIGLVVTGADGGLDVIHADTGTPGQDDAVRRVSLGTFLADVQDLGVYEVDLAGKARLDYLLYATGAVGLPFDHGFSLASADSLYCSELIWRALAAGLGEDPVPEKSTRLARVYVSVSDISENAHVRQLRTVKANTAGH